jgi:hypothetical protein
MTAWLQLPSSKGMTRIINVDHIAEFGIRNDPQHIFTLHAKMGGGDYPEEILLMKTNNEGTIKSALNQLISIKSKPLVGQPDPILEITNDGITQKAIF